MMRWTRVVAALMKGESVDWPAHLDEATFLQACDRHGATPLIAQRLRGRSAGMPEDVVARVVSAGRVHAAHEVVRRRELDSLLDRFAAAGIRMLVFKGAALARTHYAEPASRVRCDTDVLVERGDIAAAGRILSEAGYREESSSGGERISRQRIWVRTDAIGIRHAVDLHWALSNRERYARALAFEELWSRGVPLHGSQVRIPSDVDALLIAALHLAAHHHGEERLIWLYDIHLLYGGMSEDERATVAVRAREQGVEPALGAGLNLAVRWFADGGVASQVVRRTALHDFVEDLRFTPGLGQKLLLVREHVLPPAAYVLQKYGVTSRAALPALYVRRAIAGSARLLQRR